MATSTSAIAAGAAAGLAGAVYCSCASGSSAAEQGLATDSVAAFDMSDYIAARQRGDDLVPVARADRAVADDAHQRRGLGDEGAQRGQARLADGLGLPAAGAPRKDDHVVRLRRQRAHVRGADVRQAEALREGLGGAGAQR